MQVVKRIGVGSAAKVYGLTLGFLGVFIGILYALMFSFLPTFNDMPGGGFGIAMLIITPILYGLIGFVFGALGAFIYNFVASKFGGLEIELSEPNNAPAD
ncbi:hypothetical protein J0A68_20020 [Algoriphagus sp. H41]|uniref:DUF3566 domain-containing protein n=1 Tax=Algoriphagus oliviformis TaxID=2811231 RepID=A0ABS3C9L4_9BACT|nr:hypothetical protein [Algoriphagus oliviformis]MBN7813251.1 hypothetical protein [Algoriphagus oliviformis]